MEMSTSKARGDYIQKLAEWNQRKYMLHFATTSAELRETELVDEWRKVGKMRSVE